MPRSDAPGRATPPANRLLAALPPKERTRLRLEQVPLALRDVLFEAGQPVTHVYFPSSGVVSLLSPPEGVGEGVEVGLVGREGMVGLAVFLGADSSPFRCIVQVPGDALRLPADEFRSRVGRDSPLHGLLLRYTNAFLSQVSLSVSCNSLHSLEKRLCRWLLMTHVRAETDEFMLTHELLAAMLGVRRASVTEAARGLRQAGLIRYVRGQITVLDRPGLEAAACPCHRIAQREFDRLPG
jgi:CRP-like cAMP-binding protein